MIDLLKGEQFETDFTDRNLNQKIPTLRHDGLDIIESCAILQYLGETFPTSLLPLDQRKWDVLPWVYWQAANVGPIFGNKLSYTRYMTDVPDEQKAHPIERFGTEALRLVSVLDQKLGINPWVCGDQFTIATSRFILGFEDGSEQGQHHHQAQRYGMGRSSTSETGRRAWSRLWRPQSRDRSVERSAQG